MALPIKKTDPVDRFGEVLSAGTVISDAGPCVAGAAAAKSSMPEIISARRAHTRNGSFKTNRFICVY